MGHAWHEGLPITWARAFAVEVAASHGVPVDAMLDVPVRAWCVEERLSVPAAVRRITGIDIAAARWLLSKDPKTQSTYREALAAISRRLSVAEVSTVRELLAWVCADPERAERALRAYARRTDIKPNTIRAHVGALTRVLDGLRAASATTVRITVELPAKDAALDATPADATVVANALAELAKRRSVFTRRTAAAIQLGLAGLRAGEICSLTIADYD